jgi:coatomer subunit beta
MCKRNAFVVLSNISHQKAVDYLMDNFDEIASMDAMMKSAVIELIQKDALLTPNNKVPSSFEACVWLEPKYLHLIFELLESSSNTIVYEASITLASLTNNPAAIKGNLLLGTRVDISVCI